MATGSINICGMIRVASSRGTSEFPLSQVIADVEVKQNEITLAGGATNVALPLALSAGVSEALMLVIYTPAKARLHITATNGGPAPLGIKGTFIMTLNPGDGITGVTIDNLSAIDELVVSWIVVAQDASADVPGWWKLCNRQGFGRASPELWNWVSTPTPFCSLTTWRSSKKSKKRVCGAAPCTSARSLRGRRAGISATASDRSPRFTSASHQVAAPESVARGNWSTQRSAVTWLLSTTTRSSGS